jgi:hypothetical protein
VLTYFSSDDEIGEDHDVGGDGMVMIKCSDLEKKKEKNKIGSRQM